MTTSLVRFGLLLLGALALALVSFPAREAAAALRHAFVRPLSGAARRRAVCFWDAMARSFLLLGASLAAAGFVTTLSHDQPFPSIGQRMAATIYGPVVQALALAVLCVLAASRRADAAAADETHDGVSAAPRGWLGAGVGYALIAVLLAAAVLQPADRPGFRLVDWLLHAPAWLTVAGGALAAVLYRGGRRDGDAVTIGLGSAGTVCALLGLLHALHGFAGSSIMDVAGGLVFSFSACIATLVGLGALGLPREDRAVAEASSAPARLVWYGFPLVTLIVVTVAWLLVSTPMNQP